MLLDKMKQGVETMDRASSSGPRRPRPLQRKPLLGDQTANVIDNLRG